MIVEGILIVRISYKAIALTFLIFVFEFFTFSTMYSLVTKMIGSSQGPITSYIDCEIKFDFVS